MFLFLLKPDLYFCNISLWITTRNTVYN